MKTPSINSLRPISATKTMIYHGQLVWNISKIKIRFTGKQKMSKLRSRIEGHVCQGSLYPGTIKKFPFMLCSMCTKEGVDVVMSEQEINDYNKEIIKLFLEQYPSQGE